MTSKEKLAALRKSIDEAKAEIKATGKKLFKEVSKEIFEQFPALIAFKWTQYTPYFNDGDPCSFSTNEAGYYFEGDDLDDSPYEHDSYGLKGDQKKAADAVDELLGNFSDDEMEELFGDHVQVTVNRDGTVETEDYDHD